VEAFSLLALAAPPALGASRFAELSKGPEPSNLVLMALALAVLFVFRRFSRTH
jgi:hypothetical protein